MATIGGNFQSEDDLKKDQTEQGQPAPQLSSAQGSIVAPTASAPITAGGAPGQGPSSSGRFTNLQKYLNANRNTNIADNIVSNISGQQEKIQGNLNNAQNVFQQQADAAKARFAGDPSLVKNALADPSKFAENQANVDQFKAMRDAQYLGPKSLNDLQGDNNLARIQSQAQQQVGDVARQTGTEQGRFSLLNQMYGNQGYTRGQQKLDNLFLQADPNQASKLAATRTSAAQLNNQISNASQQAATTASQYQGLAQSTNQDVRKALTDAQASHQAAIDAKVQAENLNRKNSYERILKELKSGQITRTDADMLGIGQGQMGGMNIYNVDPSAYLQQGAEANKYNVSSAEDFARASALSKLADSTNNYLPEEYKTQAGTLGGVVNYNKDRLMSDIGAIKSQYENDDRLRNMRDPVTGWLLAQSGATPDAQGRMVYGNGMNGIGNASMQEQMYGADVKQRALEAQNAIRRQYGMGDISYAGHDWDFLRDNRDQYYFTQPSQGRQLKFLDSNGGIQDPNRIGVDPVKGNGTDIG